MMNLKLTYDPLCLRAFREGDSDAFFDLIERNRSRLGKYFPATVQATATPAATAALVAQRMQEAERGTFRNYVIADDNTHTLIAVLFLKDIDPKTGKAEMGFYIDSAYEGKGLVTEATGLLIQFGFGQLGLNKVFMRIAEDNPGSMRVAEKNGLKQEGLLRKDFRTLDGELIDVLYYGRLKED